MEEEEEEEGEEEGGGRILRCRRSRQAGREAMVSILVEKEKQRGRERERGKRCVSMEKEEESSKPEYPPSRLPSLPSFLFRFYLTWL